MSSGARRAVSEAIGTAFLLATVIGSGIMAQRLSGGNGALALLCNTLPTGAILTVLILILGPISGAHFNPAVSLAFAFRGGISWPMVSIYVLAQLCGAVVGVWAAHLMFELPVWQFSTHIRTGPGQWLAEAIATFGLLLTLCRSLIRGGSLRRWPLHHGGVLVYGLDVVRQSGRNLGSVILRYFCRDRACRSGCVYRRAICWDAGGRPAQPLAMARLRSILDVCGRQCPSESKMYLFQQKASTKHESPLVGASTFISAWGKSGTAEPRD
jgi:hypothetical protein